MCDYYRNYYYAHTKRTNIIIELHEKAKNNNLTELEEFDEFIKIKNQNEYLEVIKKYSELCYPHNNKPNKPNKRLNEPNKPNKRLNKYGESCELIEVRNKQECDYILNKLKNNILVNINYVSFDICKKYWVHNEYSNKLRKFVTEVSKYDERRNKQEAVYQINKLNDGNMFIINQRDIDRCKKYWTDDDYIKINKHYRINKFNIVNSCFKKYKIVTLKDFSEIVYPFLIIYYKPVFEKLDLTIIPLILDYDIDRDFYYNHCMKYIDYSFSYELWKKHINDIIPLMLDYARKKYNRPYMKNVCDIILYKELHFDKIIKSRITIENYFCEIYYNPKYLFCRNRLIKEFQLM